MKDAFCMVKYGFCSLALIGILGVGIHAAYAEPGVEVEPCRSRIPADQLGEAKATKSPLEASAAVIAEGKTIFEGKGTCFTCHGMGGKGDGEAGKALDPGPRDLSSKAFKECKSIGENFWIVKNGSPGTGMIPAVTTGILTEEEAWKAITYERTLK
jgi:mono/diheme cytochrome c family protein